MITDIEEQPTELTATITTKNNIQDPFPAVTFAKKYRWGVIDHWALKRLERLGVPNPWHAYLMGLKDGEELAKRKASNLPPPMAN